MQHMDKDLTNMLFLIRKFFSSQMASKDPMEEHLSKLGAIAKEGCYQNSHSKRSKGNNVPNEFAWKLWIFGHIFGVFRVFWSKEINMGNYSNKVIEWKINEKGKEQVIGNYV